MPSSRAASPNPLVMGIVNVTPDSFYPASRAATTAAAVEEGLRQAQEGADWIDVGGQSTRPGSDPVPEAEELRRVVPVIEALASKAGVPISIDTDKAAVAEAAFAAGARVLNDVSALRSDPGMAAVAARFTAVILMHRGGRSVKTMQEAPSYGDVVNEVRAFLAERRRAFAAAGGDVGRLLVDPGIGFGKDLGHNLSVLKHLDAFAEVAPVVVGASRKSFLGKVSRDEGPEDRLAGSLAVAAWAAVRGAKAVRVHDVKATREALDVLAAVQGAA